MARSHLLDYVVSGDWLDTILPDFVLAFTFFTSVCYGAIGPRFNHQRSAAGLSAAIGMALSGGLVWWEQAHGFSIRDLGPIAAGFAMIVLGGVMYQAIRRVGGTWAGAGIALGASLLVGWVVGLDWPVKRDIFQAVVVLAFTVGGVAFLMHRSGAGFHASARIGRPPRELPDIRHDTSDLHDGRSVANRLRRGFRRVRHKADRLHEHPEDAQDIMLQLGRMLPAAGWLTDRMARLRTRAHYVRKGHIARIEELKAAVGKLPPRAKQKVSEELVARYLELQLDVRIERLDRSVAACERRVRDLTLKARACLRNHDHRTLIDILKVAEKLQHQVSKLVRIIERTEAKLLDLAEQLAKQHAEVTGE